MLHAVLERRRGIPISLSIIWAAVACRCGLACHLLAAFPSHLLIRIPVLVDAQEGFARQPAEVTDLYLDAFNGGQLMDWPGVVNFALVMMRSRITEDYVRDFVAVLPPVQVYNRALSDEENGALSRAEMMLSQQLGRDMITS